MVVLAWPRSLSSRASRTLDAPGRSCSLALFAELPILAAGVVAALAGSVLGTATSPAIGMACLRDRSLPAPARGKE
jgi:hypothetical protein